MGTPTDQDALAQLKDLQDGQVKPALEAYKKVHPKLASAHLKLAAAIVKKDADVIEFESRSLRDFTKQLGQLVGDLDYAIGMLDEFADKEELEAARDGAGKLVQALSKVKKEVAHALEKDDHLLALADKALTHAEKKQSNVEAEWAAVRARVMADKKGVDALGAAMDRALADAVNAAKKADGALLDKAQKQARESGDGAAEGFIDEAREALASFEKAIAPLPLGADFKTIYAKEHPKIVATIAEMADAAKDIRKTFVDISVMEMQFNFRKIAETMGIPPAEAAKLGPAFSQNDAAKLKALDAAAKKYKLDTPGKVMLATLQKHGLVGKRA